VVTGAGNVREILSADAYVMAMEVYSEPILSAAGAAGPNSYNTGINKIRCDAVVKRAKALFHRREIVRKWIFVFACFE
jgi:hypothetical protein